MFTYLVHLVCKFGIVMHIELQWNKKKDNTISPYVSKAVSVCRQLTIAYYEQRN